MQAKLFDGELKLMEILWETEPASAKELSVIAAERIGWNKNTTYTVIKKLIDKQVIERSEPGFICTSLVKKADVRRAETESLLGRLYNGSKKALFSALLDDEELTADELDELRAMIDSKR